MKSKFRTGVLCLLIFSVTALLVASVGLWLLLYFIVTQQDFNRNFAIGILPFITTISFFMMVREARMKWNKLEIIDNVLLVRRFLGFGSMIRIELDQADGFTQTYEPTRVSMGLALNLYAQNQRVLEISDTTYSNFNELYKQLSTRSQDLGAEPYGFFRIVRNSFGSPIWMNSDVR